MIIDSHTHIGKAAQFNLEGATLLASMELYGIDYAFVSNLEGIEIDPESGSPVNGLSQTELNTKTADLVQENRDKLKEGKLEMNAFPSIQRDPS